MRQEKHKIVSVMQPMFLPWIGYFDLIDQADFFIFLDSVQFSKQGWQQRNRIKGDHGAQWITVPVLTKGFPDQKISDVRINPNVKFKNKTIKTIYQNYAKTRFFNDYIDDFKQVFLKPHTLLVDLNIDMILWVCRRIGIEKTFMRSSSLNPKGDKVERLIDLCQKVGADVYLSTPGSKAYIDENNLFPKSGIRLTYHDYGHPVYNQIKAPFLPYLSIIDLLFNEGPNSLYITRRGRGGSNS